MSSRLRSAAIIILSGLLIGPLLVLPLGSEDAAAAAPSPTKWRRYASNPVLAPGGSGAWDSDSSHFYMYCMFRDGSEYKLYYQGYDGSRYRIGLATSTDGIAFTKYGSNPVLNTGASGSWDSKETGGPTVIKVGGIYKMWYQGGNGTKNKIGYATSADGYSWTKYASNPVMNAGGSADFDAMHAVCPCVLYENGTYKMWYTGFDVSNSRIGYATSSDGLCWTKYASNPVLDISPTGNWDDNHLMGCTVVNVSGEYRMWYSGDSNSHWGIGYATSSDGTGWSKHSGNPVMAANGNGWEAHDSFMPAVVFNGSAYQMWYTGVSNGWVQKIGYAEGWNRIPNTPSLLAPSDSDWLTNNTPTFGWTFSDVDEKDLQTAFQIQLDNDSGFGSPEYDSEKILSSSTSFQPITGLPDGVFYWRARVWDTDGDNSTWSAGRLIKIDTMPPESLSLSINGGAGYTNNRYATLTVGASDRSPGSGLGYMAFSNDGSAFSSWETFKSERASWDLVDPRYGGVDADGPKQVLLKVRDLAGNEVAPANRAGATIFLDRVAPVKLGLVINSGEGFTNSPDVTLAPSATDPEPASGPGQMAFSNDGNSFCDWMEWREAAAWSLTAGPGGQDSDGPKEVWFKVRDRAGNGAGPVSGSIFLDRKAPEGLSIVINKGAEFTNSSTVELELSAEDPEPASTVSGMSIANAEPAPGTWEAFSTSRAGWSLTAGAGGTDEDGNKTVFARVRDRAGNQAGPANDTIFLDRAGPVSLSVIINGGATYTTKPSVTLSLGASDPSPASGVDRMQFSSDGSLWSSWEPFETSKSYLLSGNDGTKTVYFRVIDRAQNLAGAVSDSIILDTVPPSISNVRVSGLTHNSAVVSWSTDEEAACGLDYGPSSSYGSSASSAEYLSDHVLQLRNLLASTTYHFRVSATDRAQNPTTFSRDFVFITAAMPDTTPPFILDLAVSGITDRLAVASWTTNEPADATLDYGPDTSYGKTASDSRFVIIHTFTITGLSPSTTYHARASSTDPSGNGPERSGDVTFATLGSPDVAPPVISNINVNGITDNLAVVSWTTDEPADGMIEYGTTTGYGRIVELSGLSARHESTLGALLPSTTYHFRVSSRDATGNGPAISEDRTFTTGAAPDLSPPAILNLRIETVTTGTATVIWETVEVADGYLEYGTDIAYGLSYTLPGYALIHKVLISGLQPDTTYHVRVRSVDPSGNQATGGDNVFRTMRLPSPSDITSPIISGIQVVGISDIRAVVLWQTDEPANSRVDYGTGPAYGLAASDHTYAMLHSIVLAGLQPSTGYHFRVGSSDAYGNGPSLGADMAFTTTAAPDRTAPRLSAISVTEITNTSAVVRWATDEPGNGRVEYGTGRDYGRNRTSAAFVLVHFIRLDGLTPGTVYHFRIASADPGGNAAPPSTDLTFTTKGGPSPPGPNPRPSGTISIGGVGWPYIVLAMALVLAAVAGVFAMSRKGSGANQGGYPSTQNHAPALGAALPPPSEPTEEILEMDPPQEFQPEPVQVAQPLKHVRCSVCRTRIPIYSNGPQRIVCPGCGKAGMFRGGT